MNCEKASELISLKQDVELDREQEHALQQHLAVCPECRRLLTRMEHMTRLMGGSGVLAPRADFSERVMQQVRRRNRYRAVLGSLAVFALAGVLVSILMFAPAGAGLAEIQVPSLSGTLFEGISQFLGILTTIWQGLRSAAGAAVNSPGNGLFFALAGGGVFLSLLWLSALRLVSSRSR